MSSISVVSLAILSCVNIVLTLALVRRLNRQPRTASPVEEMDFPLPAPGTPVGSFVATTTGGERIGTKNLTGRILVGFFTVGCPPCERLRPEFRALASTFPGGRDQVLAVISGGTGDPTSLAGQLDDIARVIVEPPAGQVSTAFGIDAFPAVCLLKGNVVTAAEFDLESLTRHVPEPATGLGVR